MKTIITRALALTLIFFFFHTALQAQVTIVKAVNDEFNIEIHRNGTVMVLVKFVDPAKYETAIIEKGAWMDGAFRPCAYIDLMNSTEPVIDADVDYPLNSLYDSYYRVRVITRDGMETIYTPIRVPAQGETRQVISI